MAKRFVTVPGYSYRRYLGYTYRRVKGRRRRVHHYKLVKVPARRYELKPKRKPKPKPKPKPRVKKTPAVLQAPQGWIKAAEWQDYLDQWADNQGMQIKWDGDLYKKSPASDWISKNLFVWPTPRFPRKVILTGYEQLKHEVFKMVRVWVLIEHSEDKELFVWCRTVYLRHMMGYDEMTGEIAKMTDAIAEDVKEFPYLAFRGLVGWTGYMGEQKSSYRKKKEGTD